MTTKTVQVAFVQSSKAVTAQVKVEYTGEVDNNNVLRETEELMEQALAYSNRKTIQLSR